MRVRLTIEDEGILIEPTGCRGGGHVGATREVALQPGQTWHGWKYRRLRKLGDGEHVLLAKSDPSNEGAVG